MEMLLGNLETLEVICAKGKQPIQAVNKLLCCILLFFALLFSSCTKKGEPELIIEFIKQGQLNEATAYIKSIKESNEVKDFLLAYVGYLKDGFDKEKILLKTPKAFNQFPNAYKTMYYYMTGDIIFGLNKKVEAYDYYLKAKKFAKKESQFLQNEVLKRILGYFQKKAQHNLELFKQYKATYLSQKHDKIDVFWLQYYNLWLRVHEEWLRKLKNQDSFVTNIKAEEFDLLIKSAGNTIYFKGKVNQLLGIYYSSLVNNFTKADSIFNNAKELFQNDQFFFSKKESIKAKINVGISLMRKKEYDTAIYIFQKSLQSPILKGELYGKQLVYNNLAQCYNALKKKDSIYFLKKRDSIKYTINKYVNGLLVENKEYKNQVIDKKEENDKLNKKNEMLIVSIITLILLSALIYYNWSLSKRKNKNLEEERTETIERLKELKSIVIKNHIILKDKTKIYISDLMYIKSDDHYLNFYTSEGKKHFVRGKISQIKKELPPNFIQSHRSYIVNRNFIKQITNSELFLINNTDIPISRSFKDRFK